MDETLEELFKELDNNLSELGLSDSIIEYAPHAREPFDKVITILNEIRTYLGGDYQSSDSYFDED